MYRIFVPTRGRVDKQVSRRALALDHLGRPVVYVVPECELALWEGEGVKTLTVPDEYRFSDIRQFILEQPGRYHVVIDDDLRMAKRLRKGDWHAVNLQQMPLNIRLKKLNPLFKDIARLLRDGWVHGGVSAREGNNHVLDNYACACREMRFHFYNASVVRQLGYDFRRVATKQDFDFTLWMLRRGIPNIVIYKYLQGQSGSNATGGCSLYRDDAVIKSGAMDLARLHPKFVQVVEKKTRNSWGGGTRIDVRVQWKKAYQEGLEYVQDLRRQDPKTLDDQDRVLLRLQSELPVLPDQLST